MDFFEDYDSIHLQVPMNSYIVNISLSKIERLVVL